MYLCIKKRKPPTCCSVSGVVKEKARCASVGCCNGVTTYYSLLGCNGVTTLFSAISLSADIARSKEERTVRKNTGRGEDGKFPKKGIFRVFLITVCSPVNFVMFGTIYSSSSYYATPPFAYLVICVEKKRLALSTHILPMFFMHTYNTRTDHMQANMHQEKKCKPHHPQSTKLFSQTLIL